MGYKVNKYYKSNKKKTVTENEFCQHANFYNISPINLHLRIKFELKHLLNVVENVEN